MLCSIITPNCRKASQNSTNEIDLLGNAYEFLIGQLQPDLVKKQVNSIPSTDIHYSFSDSKYSIAKILEMVKKPFIPQPLRLCLWIRFLAYQCKKNNWNPICIGQIYGQEKNITTYNLARMNMLLHGFQGF
jgi:type I restriction enzyme M protein